MPRLTALPGGRERFGKYEILRRLATGGMAEIYLARATGIEGFEKLVVLKRILPQYAGEDEFVSMFLDEARLAATLHHSNVVSVYDIGEVDGQYFLAMEFLHGQDARQLMKTVSQQRTGLPLEHALSVVMGVCAGLHYAHEHVVDGKPLELVHRDVSPQNVFITYDGHVKLLDFGIARASSRLTQTRGTSLKGKISYMSPEQAGGLPLDRRSDVFSTAILLWELTTGRRLYTGDSDFEVMRKLREEDAPRPSVVGFAYPLALERIVLKGLKRDREERYASAEELLLDLEGFAREARVPVSAVRLSRYMRETFREQLEKWNQLARGDAAATPSTAPLGHTETTRTETSVPGPAPPLMYSDPAVPLVAPRRSGRAWIAVAIGIVVGSLATWMAARESRMPPVAEVQPAARTVAAPPAAIVATPVSKTIAAPGHSAELPMPETPEHELATKPIVGAKPMRAAAVDKPARRSAPPRRAVKKPSKKLPQGWDPESILPP